MQSIRRYPALVLLSCALLAPAGAEIVDNKAGRTVALPDTLGPSVNVLGTSSRRDDCDDIRFNVTPRADRSANITLRTSGYPGPGTWDKQMELFIDGRMITRAKAPGQGGHSSVPMLIPPDQLHKAQLLLMKAKAFDVLTGVYQIVGLSRFAGNNVEIFWYFDHC